MLWDADVPWFFHVFSMVFPWFSPIFEGDILVSAHPATFEVEIDDLVPCVSVPWIPQLLDST